MTSWVICERDTGRPVFETWDARIPSQLNTARYTAVPILEYLQALNRQIKADDAKRQEKRP